jgi:hypothetical protein
MEDDNMVLIAQPLLESTIGAYIEWNENKEAPLVKLSAVA